MSTPIYVAPPEEPIQSTLPIASGGTGQTSASAAFDALKQAATTSATGVVELSTPAEDIAGTSGTLVSTPAGQAAARLDALPPFTVILRNAPATNVVETDVSIGAAAYQSDASVTAVLGGKNTTSVANNAFYSCSSLTSISLPAATSIGNDAFYGTALASVSLPLAETIGYNAFYNCSALTSISLPSATTIGGDAFYSCGFSTIQLPSVITIEDGLFGTFPTALTSVSLPLAETIGDWAFGGCSSLTSISLPAATSIGDGAFDGTALVDLALPAATSIGAYAFSLGAVTGGLYLNAPLAGIAANAFDGSSITTIHLRPAPNTPAGWTIGPGQTIAGQSGITVVDDWTTYPDLP